MARTYNKASIQNQLHVISKHIEEHFPGHYAEHLEQVGKLGICDRAIIIMVELKMKVDALGKALIDAQKEMGDSLQFSTSKGIPGPPGPMGPAGPTQTIRNITPEESYAYMDSYTPVIVHTCVEEGEGDKDVIGNIVGHVEDENGNIELEVDVGGTTLQLPLNRVFVDVS